MSELREIERLDEAKVDRVVAAVSPLVRDMDRWRWAIGDALLVEWPLVTPGAGQQRRWRRGGTEPVVRRYLEAIGRQVDRSWTTLEHYRCVAAAYRPEDRVESASFSLHVLVAHVPEREELLHSGLTTTAVRTRLQRLAAQPGSSPASPAAERRSRLSPSFSNISKAAAAAIEVLSDESLSSSKRVDLALSILVRFFDEAAAA